MKAIHHILVSTIESKRGVNCENPVSTCTALPPGPPGVDVAPGRDPAGQPGPPPPPPPPPPPGCEQGHATFTPFGLYTASSQLSLTLTPPRTVIDRGGSLADAQKCKRVVEGAVGESRKGGGKGERWYGMARGFELWRLETTVCRCISVMWPETRKTARVAVLQ